MVRSDALGRKSCPNLAGELPKPWKTWLSRFGQPTLDMSRATFPTGYLELQSSPGAETYSIRRRIKRSMPEKSSRLKCLSGFYARSKTLHEKKHLCQLLKNCELAQPCFRITLNEHRLKLKCSTSHYLTTFPDQELELQASSEAETYSIRRRIRRSVPEKSSR